MLDRGSDWFRWEPHIHGPGTILNNQFGGPTEWQDYLSALEAAQPVIRAVAVTDYYTTDTYERVLAEKSNGRLPAVELVFPNIELRLDVAAKGGFVNLHLFVSPEDDDHVVQVQRLLGRLQFRAFNDTFDCTRSELIRLGRRFNVAITHDDGALSEGANQFKVNFKDLINVYRDSDWAKKNILIAVAGGAKDGTAGIRAASDQVIREEIEKFADIIFAGSPAQREFWLGQRSLTARQVQDRYGGLKPCLHGSDAHKIEDVGLPFGDRFSWIKGALEFDSLRQACIEPTQRAFVGPEPPPAATPSQVIASVRVHEAPWLTTPEIPLNSGLVAIIGARGSGKTALVDLIAAGADAITPETFEQRSPMNASFLARARPLIGAASVELNWMDGGVSDRSIDGSVDYDASIYPRARYLSQQFVEQLCSSTGLSDRLLEEIERVIFETHPIDSREGAIDFEELLRDRTERHRLARRREAEAVSQISDRIAEELEKERSVELLKSQVTQKTTLVANYTNDRKKLIPRAPISASSATPKSRLRRMLLEREYAVSSIKNRRF